MKYSFFLTLSLTHATHVSLSRSLTSCPSSTFHRTTRRKERSARIGVRRPPRRRLAPLNPILPHVAHTTAWTFAQNDWASLDDLNDLSDTEDELLAKLKEGHGARAPDSPLTIPAPSCQRLALNPRPPSLQATLSTADRRATTCTGTSLPRRTAATMTSRAPARASPSRRASSCA